MITSNSKELVKKTVKKQRKLKTLEDLTIRDDYMFSKVMSFQKICKEFLEAIFNIEIEKIEYINVEERIKTTYEHKGVRLDVYIKDKIGTVYNIEMQLINYKNLAKRARYYQAMIDSSLLLKNTDYNLLNKSFIIFICPFKLFDEARQIYTFKNFCEENKNIQLEDEATKIFISTKNKKEKKLNANLEAFLEYVNGKMPDNSFVKEIDETIKYIKKDEKERDKYMKEHLLVMDSKRLGKEQQAVEDIKLAMKNFHISLDQAIKGFEINSKEDQALFTKLINDPEFYDEYFYPEAYYKIVEVEE